MSEKFKQEIWETIKMIIFVVLVVYLLDGVIFINAKIPSGSMENTVMTGDRIFGFRLAYGINLDFLKKDILTVPMKDPERFDIVIFRYPGDESELYIKRIIGLPGETVEVRKGNVYIDGAEVPIEEPFMEVDGQREKRTNRQSEMGDGIYKVPEGCYFVMGDNRINSSDSRFWTSTHYVTYNQIVGKAIFRYWPLNQIKWLGSGV